MPSERFVAFGYSPELDLPSEQIVPLNASGTGSPIVLFAGIHGFAPFADTLRAIGPLFEAPLSAVKLPFDLEALPSVETLAASYPDRIEARFGPAPCVIAGYSIAIGGSTRIVIEQGPSAGVPSTSPPLGKLSRAGRGGAPQPPRRAAAGR